MGSGEREELIEADAAGARGGRATGTELEILADAAEGGFEVSGGLVEIGQDWTGDGFHDVSNQRGERLAARFGQGGRPGNELSLGAARCTAPEFACARCVDRVMCCLKAAPPAVAACRPPECRFRDCRGGQLCFLAFLF
ncbi:MAG: hypothetical protein HPY59_14215 [Anaerolineae bacterium]|nr:hypothetical protein [Anaerolineae bacterium]